MNVDIVDDNNCKNILSNIFNDLYVEANISGNEAQMYLPKGIYIICDTNTTTSTTETNLSKYSFGYVVKSTGYVNISGQFILSFCEAVS